MTEIPARSSATIARWRTAEPTGRSRIAIALVVVLAMLGAAGFVAAAAPPEPAIDLPATDTTVEPGRPPVELGAPPLEPPKSVAAPRSVKLWPLFEYESDPATQTRHVRILGPLLEYRTDAERLSFFFRPLLSISQSRVGHDDDVRILSGLLTSHWGQTEQLTTGLGGLATYRTRTQEDSRTLVAQQARVLPVYFYDWESPEPFGRFSLAPLYADVEDVFGYERVQMAMFPAYLRLQQPPVDRHYFLFPLISRDGEPGSGYRLWPFPLRDRHGTRLERQATAARSTPHTFFPRWRDEFGDAEPRSLSE